MMMWHFRLAQDDKVFKLTFEHLRNIGICAALLVASSWRFEHAGTDGNFWLDCAAATLVGIVAILLFLANAAYLARKLAAGGFSRRATILWPGVPAALFEAMVMPHIPRLLNQFR